MRSWRRGSRFTEYWMPVREIGGISRANLSGVISLARRGNALVVGFNANRDLPKASVSILNGTSRIFSEKVDLAPERAGTNELPDPHFADEVHRRNSGFIGDGSDPPDGRRI